nr:uncharacterized protein YccU-like [Nerophis lumbriciformis]
MSSPVSSQNKTIAVLGASNKRSKFGNKCVRAYLDEGWQVWPVNPRGGEIEGQKVARQLSDIDSPLDRISVYLPPPLTLKLLPEIAAAQAGEVWLNPGSASPEVLAEARAAGIPVIDRCSIVDIGRSPSEYP